MIYEKSNTISNICLKIILFLLNVTDSFSSATKGLFRAMSKILDGAWKPFTIYVKRCILDALQGSEYAYGIFLYTF